MPNTTWSLDFVSDRTESGRTFRVLNIIDDCNREAVAQEAYMSMPAERVISVLEEVIYSNGKPECIRTVLDAYIFRNLDEVRFLTEKWRVDYNNNRPHEALGNMTPIEYKQFILNKKTYL